MLSAIRKLFKPQSKADRDAREHQKQTTASPPPARPPPRGRSQRHVKAAGHQEATAAQEGDPRSKRDVSRDKNSRCSASAAGRTGSCGTGESADHANDDTQSCSAGTSTTGSGTQSSDNANGTGANNQQQQQHAEQGNHAIAVDGDKNAAEQDLDPEGGKEDLNNAEEAEDENAEEDEPEDEEELDPEDSCRIPFIAEAAARHPQAQHPHVHAHHHQFALLQSLQSQGTLPQHASTAILATRKTDVDQLLTGNQAANSHRRDGVRGNLEELRVAESVNYRPVVYRYSFRVLDIPANMRVFTDPDDRRIEAIARSCDSQIDLEKLAIRGPGSLKMRKVTIQAPDLHSLEKCCRQFDDRFPHFYVSGGLGLSSKSIQRVYLDELEQQQQQQQ